MKLSASILTASTEGHRACRKTADWWCPDFENPLVPSLQQSVWRYVRNTNPRLWKHLQALLSLSILQLEHFMAQAVWNRYCGQQHKYWICQESWHCFQHICNCNLAPTRSNSKQPLRNNIFFPSPFLFFEETQRKSLQMTQCSSFLHPDRLGTDLYVHVHPHSSGKYSSCCPCPCWMSGVLSFSAAALGE